MTHKSYLEQLANIAAEKSDAYMKISYLFRHRSLRLTRSNADKLKNARDEWELAEKAYADYLISIKMKQLDINDVMTDEPALTHTGMK